MAQECLLLLEEVAQGGESSYFEKSQQHLSPS
jgi:hypothetical protein